MNQVNAWRQVNT